MRTAAPFLLFLLLGASPETRYFQSQRQVENLPSHPGQACLALEEGIFAQAAPALADLRLYRDGKETPYITRLAEPSLAPQGEIDPLNKGLRGGQTVFDADLPDGHYLDLELEVSARNFIATVEVSGSQTQSRTVPTRLGSYTIFDLTRQRLGRSTVLHLPESDFKYLHFRIIGPLGPEQINGLSVLRLPESQPRYTTLAETAKVSERNHDTVVEFIVPPHVPVDRVVLRAGPQPSLFSRDAFLRVEPAPASPTDPQPYPETARAKGNLLRIHTLENGHRIDEEHLTLDAPAADFDRPAKWTITIDNGDDPPLEVESVRLQMVERDLCFEAAGNGHYTLYYGDRALAAPRYDYRTLFALQADAASVVAGRETANTAYQPRPDERAFTERHPALLWIALVLVIGLLGGIALLSLKKSPTAPPA
ncbi:MAG TPA: DUF3999 family protein [Terracidiphilus sp.]|jgi:hypothetical protein